MMLAKFQLFVTQKTEIFTLIFYENRYSRIFDFSKLKNSPFGHFSWYRAEIRDLSRKFPKVSKTVGLFTRFWPINRSKLQKNVLRPKNRIPEIWDFSKLWRHSTPYSDGIGPIFFKSCVIRKSFLCRNLKRLSQS